MRVPPEWVEKADKLATELSRPGLPVSRADAFRVLIAKGLEAYDAETAKAKRSSK